MLEKFLAGIMDLNFSVKIAIFQNSVNSLKMIEVVLQNLITEPGIQLADALAGLSRYYFDNPEAKEAKKWMRKLQFLESEANLF